MAGLEVPFQHVEGEVVRGGNRDNFWSDVVPLVRRAQASWSGSSGPSTRLFVYWCSVMELMDLAEIEAAQALLLTVHAALPSTPPMRDWRDGPTIQFARAAAAKGQSVLLKGGHRSVLLSPSGLERWLGKYHLEIPLSISGDPATEGEAMQGIGWVLKVGPPGRELHSAEEIEQLDQTNPLFQAIAAEFKQAKRD